MLRMHLPLIVVGFSIMGCAFGDSTPQYMCAGRPIEVVHSIANISVEIQGLIGYGRPGIDGLVDSTAELNTTDPSRPMRRFMWAALNSQCVFVLIERAGQHHYEEYDFRRAPERWITNNHTVFSGDEPTVATMMHGGNQSPTRP
jgi:hypothetical protein